MDQTPGALLDHSRLPRGPLTVDDYYRLAREGVLDPDVRVELIEGELVFMNAISSPHASVVAGLVQMLGPAVAGRSLLWVQNPVRLDQWNEPEPDVALLLPRADRYRHAHPSAADVLLLIEVADSSLAVDCGRKRDLYARFGVREYWVVDIEGGQVEVCRDPRPDGYASIVPAGMEAVLDVAALPGVAVAVRDVLG